MHVAQQAVAITKRGAKCCLVGVDVNPFRRMQSQLLVVVVVVVVNVVAFASL